MFEELIGKKVIVKFKDKEKWWIKGILVDENHQFIKVRYLDDGRHRVIDLNDIKDVIEVRD
jgi:RNase P/RNase MRP subunit p29